MRSERLLRKEGRLHIIDDICALLATTPLPIPPTQYSKLFFGAAMPHAELALRQYVYLRQVLYKLPRSLLAMLDRSGGHLVYPLPAPWRKLVAGAGFAVQPVLSRLLWIAYVLFYWAYGCLTIGQLLAQAAQGTKQAVTGKFAHFEYIGEGQTPRPAEDGRSFDVMTWYRLWLGRAPDIEGLSYRIKGRSRLSADSGVHALRTPALPVLAPGPYLRFVGWCLAAIGLSAADLLRGRWWHAMMLSEAALARFVSGVPTEALARDYLFNNSGWLYRPLWSYEAERRGSRILCYHYSTNSAAFKRPDGYPPEHYTWRITNWPLHVVWDEEQAAFIRRAVGETDVQIAGPIWFSSTPEPSPSLDKPSIAVFDVQPFRPSMGPLLAAQYNYYAPETCLAFVEDASRAIGEAGFQMLWKRKRSIGKGAHPKYREMARRIDAHGLALVVSPDQSAVRIIEVADAVVSMPFTSTAILARHLGKPSCYYDPSGAIHKDDRGAHDIPVLVGYEDLASWVRSLQHARTTIVDD